jgi:hypothetical protein
MMLSARFVLALLLSLVNVSAQAPTAQEQPSNPFVGTWVLNLAKSTYDVASPKKHSTRTIDVQANGVVIQTHRNLQVSGEGFSHWVGNLDGKEFTEFARQRGTRPGNRLTIKKVSDHVWNVTFRNQEGHIVLTDTWTVSPDGKTLTIDRKGTPLKGPPTHSVEIYENDGWALPQTRPSSPPSRMD